MLIKHFFKNTKNDTNYSDKNQDKNLVDRTIIQLNKTTNDL